MTYVGTTSDGRLLEWEPQTLALHLNGEPATHQQVRALLMSGAITFADGDTEAAVRQLVSLDSGADGLADAARPTRKGRLWPVVLVALGLLLAAGVGYALGSWETRVAAAEWESNLAAAKDEAFDEGYSKGSSSRDGEVSRAYSRGLAEGRSEQQEGVAVLAGFDARPTGRSRWYAVQLSENAQDTTGKMSLYINAISENPIHDNELPSFSYTYW